MNVKRRGFVWRLALCVLFTASLAALRFFAIAEPQTQLGYAVFRASYALSSNKHSALQGYNANLIKHNAGYIPEQVDNFLCSNLQNSISEEEFVAISDFYAHKAGGREGRRIFALPAQTKQRITGLILSRLENYPPHQASRALILIEVLRRGKYLGKANLGPARNVAPSYPTHEIWWEQRGLPEAKAKFRRWWKEHPTWQQREKHNPLEYSSVQIYSP